MPQKLPHTLARIPQSCEILASSLGNIDPRSILLERFSNLIGKSEWSEIIAGLLPLIGASYLGFIQKLTIHETRETKPIYTLGDYSPSEMIPGNVSYTGEAERVWLNASSRRFLPSPSAQPTFNENLGFPSGDIAKQLAPFILIQKFYSPNPKSGEWDLASMYVYVNCWITKMDFNTDFKEGKYMIESMSFSIGKIITFDTTILGSLSLRKHIGGFHA